ncbi:uncharacterized protein LOC124349118 isoform X2 [Daphnia pulicaria]|uniref:uncharacterized protein LOC124349118 isoform X2 n=1 Tax=Daphnia pulicaria TaxID=35523 RepID=UPI001EEC82C6|nr:uncharacterized protein LOC124349118 isoform X2 [Daphnia pulicaria]
MRRLHCVVCNGPKLRMDTSSNISDLNISPLFAELCIPFQTADLANVAYNSLRVDKEPKRSSTTKTLSLEGNSLKVSFKSGDTRQLRTAVNSFLDLLILVSRAIDEFTPVNFKFENVS